VREGIWVRTLNVLNLKYERLVHNSAKVVPLQIVGKFSLLLPYVDIDHRLMFLVLGRKEGLCITPRHPRDDEVRGPQRWAHEVNQE
jgi:hypothetical protein